MWGNYGKSSNSVAIQITHTDLRAAYVQSDIKMASYFDPVRYEEPSNARNLYNGKPVTCFFPNNNTYTMDPISHHVALNAFVKHKAFLFEKEARLVLVDTESSQYENDSLGVYFSPDCSREMINKVILHPQSSTWFQEMIETLIQQTYGINIPVVTSELRGNLT